MVPCLRSLTSCRSIAGSAALNSICPWVHERQHTVRRAAAARRAGHGAGQERRAAHLNAAKQSGDGEDDDPIARRYVLRKAQDAFAHS